MVAANYNIISTSLFVTQHDPLRLGPASLRAQHRFVKFDLNFGEFSRGNNKQIRAGKKKHSSQRKTWT